MIKINPIIIITKIFTKKIEIGNGKLFNSYFKEFGG